MAKIGVGVGEEFPIDEKTGASSGSQGANAGPGPHSYDAGADRGYGCGAGSGGWDRDEWRARRREWRARRREWRSQHRAWRRRFRAEMAARGYPRFPFVFFPLVPIAIAAFVLTLLITGFITIIASAPFVVIALIVLGVLYLAHRGRDHHHHWDTYDATPSSGPSASPPANPPPRQEG